MTLEDEFQMCNLASSREASVLKSNQTEADNWPEALNY